MFFNSFISGFPQHSILRIDSINLCALHFGTWPHLRGLIRVVLLSKSRRQKEEAEPLVSN